MRLKNALKMMFDVFSGEFVLLESGGRDGSAEALGDDGDKWNRS